MTRRMNPTPHPLKPLAACIGALFCLPAISAIGATHTVGNCLDSGSGSLRAVIAASTTHSGDTLDMTMLTCTISLKTGITIAQNSLTLNGSGQDTLTITAYGTTKHRMLRHTGTGTLKVNNMSIAHGYAGTSAAAPPSRGGCIVSAGSVSLDRVEVTACTASGTSAAYGGGIYAHFLSLQHSTLSGNIVSTSGGSGSASGGGAATYDDFTASDSLVEDNAAKGDFADGGGLSVTGNFTLTASSVSGNHSGGEAGGAQIGRPIHLPTNLPTVNINNSTVSGNDASTFAGGIVSEYAVTLRNSTIAFNTAGLGNFASQGHTYFVGAGLAVDKQPVELQSSLIANNSYGTFHQDSDFSTLGTATGANNLIRYSHGSIPTDTLSDACPLLGSLRNNGGETKTHALLSHSPGIDAGNNAAAFPSDQRRLPFVRVYGSAADIGAYEVQAEIIFNNDFDGCPPLPI